MTGFVFGQMAGFTRSRKTMVYLQKQMVGGTGIEPVTCAV
jgi:hypothetical protein